MARLEPLAPRRAIAYRSWMDLGVSDEFLEGLGRDRRMHDEHIGRGSEHGNRREVLDGIVGQVLEDGYVDAMR